VGVTVQWKRWKENTEIVGGLDGKQGAVRPRGTSGVFIGETDYLKARDTSATWKCRDASKGSAGLVSKRGEREIEKEATQNVTSRRELLSISVTIRTRRVEDA